MLGLELFIHTIHAFKKKNPVIIWFHLISSMYTTPGFACSELFKQELYMGRVARKWPFGHIRCANIQMDS